MYSSPLNYLSDFCIGFPPFFFHSFIFVPFGTKLGHVQGLLLAPCPGVTLGNNKGLCDAIGQNCVSCMHKRIPLSSLSSLCSGYFSSFFPFILAGPHPKKPCLPLGSEVRDYFYWCLRDHIRFQGLNLGWP